MLWLDAGTGSLTVLKRTSSAGNYATAAAAAQKERPASVTDKVNASEMEARADAVDDDGDILASPPPPDSTDALKFCSARSQDQRFVGYRLFYS